MLSQRVKEYVAEHRAMGFKYYIQNGLLLRFAEFAEERGERLVKTTTVIDWCDKSPSPRQKRNRLLTVRRFAKWIRPEDSAHQIPPDDVFGRVVLRRRTPHIYSDAEIDALLVAASCLNPKGSIRPLTFRTLIGLLVTSGLRISEALSLDVSDISNDGLVVRATKFHKDRLVPIHRSTRDALERYVRSSNRPLSESNAVFVSLWGTRLAYSTAISSFLTLIRAIGIRQGPGHPGPCFHDMRHTFAVRSLEQCPANAKAVADHMISLCTYLGHVHMSDTYWYLEATPKLTSQIAKDGEALYKEELS